MGEYEDMATMGVKQYNTTEHLVEVTEPSDFSTREPKSASTPFICGTCSKQKHISEKHLQPTKYACIVFALGYADTNDAQLQPARSLECHVVASHNRSPMLIGSTTRERRTSRIEAHASGA
jgi:hypothetical protein